MLFTVADPQGNGDIDAFFLNGSESRGKGSEEGLSAEAGSSGRKKGFA